MQFYNTAMLLALPARIAFTTPIDLDVDAKLDARSVRFMQSKYLDQDIVTVNLKTYMLKMSQIRSSLTWHLTRMVSTKRSARCTCSTVVA